MTPEERCARDAALSHNVIRRDKAIALGMSSQAISRRISKRTWRVIYPGVYFTGFGRASRKARIAAACLWGGEGSVASHESAAELHRLSVRLAAEPAITVARRQNSAHGIRVHLDPKLERGRTVKVDSIPATTIERTILDMCAVLDRKGALALVETTVREQRTELSRLARMLDGFHAPRPAGSKTLGWILNKRFGRGVTDSAAEDLFLRLARRYRLPQGLVHHHVVRDEGPRRAGGFVAELDFAYVAERLAIEIDGDRFHCDPVSGEADRHRDSELGRRGWAVLRFTYWQLCNEPEWVARCVKETLAARRLHLFSG